MAAGRHPCLLAGQCSMRSDHGGHSGPIAAQSGPVGSPTNLQGMYSGPAQARSAGAAASPKAATARPAVGGPYRGVQGKCQPMTARGPPAPCPTGYYHSSGASTWRGPYCQPLAIGSNRCAAEIVRHHTKRHVGNACICATFSRPTCATPFPLEAHMTCCFRVIGAHVKGQWQNLIRAARCSIWHPVTAQLGGTHEPQYLVAQDQWSQHSGQSTVVKAHTSYEYMQRTFCIMDCVTSCIVYLLQKGRITIRH